MATLTEKYGLELKAWQSGNYVDCVLGTGGYLHKIKDEVESVRTQKMMTILQRNHSTDGRRTYYFHCHTIINEKAWHGQFRFAIINHRQSPNLGQFKVQTEKVEQIRGSSV